MPITTDAPRFLGDGRIRVEEHTYRDPGDGELLVKVAANALCGTDRSIYLNGTDIIPGHEAAGVIADVGPGSRTAVGTRGVIYLMDYCGSCRSCLIGATNQCTAKRADVGLTSDGGYGPYATVHETNFFPVGDDLPLATATMLLDVMGTSSHALHRAELVRPDIESIYICGAGPIGLGLLVMAQIRYGVDFPIYISDLSDWRCEFARTFGATVVDASSVRDLAPDIAVDSSGKEAACRAALTSLSKRGALVCVGHGEGLTLDVSADLIAPERAVLGSEYFRFDELAHNLVLLQENEELVSRIITHQLPVARLSEAFDLFLSGKTGKVVVLQDVEA